MKIHSPEIDGAFVDGFNKSVAKVLSRTAMPGKLLPTPPADPNRLKLVWSLWHLLPTDWSGELRVALLRAPATEIPRLRQRLTSRAKSKRKGKRRPQPVGQQFWREFKGQFSASDGGTFEAACWWHSFVEQFNRLFACTKLPDGTSQYDRLDFAIPQLSFRDFLMHDARDVATARTARELKINFPDFWQQNAPPLDLVAKARRRWAAYMSARQSAAEMIGKLIAPGPPPADSQHRMARHRRDQKQLVDFLAGDFWKLSLYQQEHYINENFQPLRQDYEDFADYIACDAVAPDTLHNFMGDKFFKLTLEQKLHFVRLCRQRRPNQKKNAYTILRAWLLDNAPVFQEFQWSLPFVFAQVTAHFIRYPGDQDSVDSQHVFKNALHDWGIVLKLPRGPSSQTTLRGRRSELLTKPASFIFK